MLLVPALAACGGGNSESGVAGGGSATPFTGNWFLVATLNVNIGGTATARTDTTRVMVGASGNTVIVDTDTDCTLNIFVNGNVLTYESMCVFTAASEDATAPCVLTFLTRARIRGEQGSALLSSSFGAQTEVCSGAAVSYSGNLVGNQGTGPDTDMDGDTDDDMDDTEDMENGDGTENGEEA